MLVSKAFHNSFVTSDCFGTNVPCCPFSLSSSLLFLSKTIALSYHSPIVVGGLSASISFLLIPPFIPLLNSSINSLLSYSLPQATLLNSYTNSSIILPPCFNFFNSTTFTNSLSPPPNSFFIAIKKFPH